MASTEPSLRPEPSTAHDAEPEHPAEDRRRSALRLWPLALLAGVVIVALLLIRGCGGTGGSVTLDDEAQPPADLARAVPDGDSPASAEEGPTDGPSGDAASDASGARAGASITAAADTDSAEPPTGDSADAAAASPEDPSDAPTPVSTPTPTAEPANAAETPTPIATSTPRRLNAPLLDDQVDGVTATAVPSPRPPISPTPTATPVITATPTSTPSRPAPAGDTEGDDSAPGATSTPAATAPSSPTPTRPAATATPRPPATSTARPQATVTSTATATPRPPVAQTATPRPGVATATPPPTATTPATATPTVTAVAATSTPVPTTTTTPTPTATATPPPTSTPTATPTPVGPPAELGIALGGGIYDLPMTLVNERFDQLAAAGVQWVRLDLNWAFIEPTPGTFVWDEVDAVTSAARARGLRVLGILAYTPAWARPAGTNDKHAPNSIDDFANFAAQASARYRGQILAWEIWNEPNHLPFWSSGPDPAFYGDLLTASAQQIRANQPAAFIVSGGLSPAVDGSGSIAPETFMNGFLPRVPSGLINAVGIHPYSFPAMPTDQFSWNTFARMPAMLALATSFDPGLVLWPTEYGAPVLEVSEAEQARAIRLAAECTTRHGWLGPLFVFTLQDLGGDTFGIRDELGNPRQAWSEIESLTQGADIDNCLL